VWDDSFKVLDKYDNDIWDIILLVTVKYPKVKLIQTKDDKSCERDLWCLFLTSIAHVHVRTHSFSWVLVSVKITISGHNSGITSGFNHSKSEVMSLLLGL
jgi:hypothetical protein